MLWDCIFATASKMLEILRSPHLIKRATCATKRQHGRRRVSCERDATETTTCSFRREVSATFTAICEDGSSASEMRVVSLERRRRRQRGEGGGRGEREGAEGGGRGQRGEGGSRGGGGDSQREGLSFRQSSSSMSDRTGQPVVETMAKSREQILAE